MSVQHPELQKWETRLKVVFDGIDDVLEEKYGAQFPLHPARAKRGATSNREQDGLFNVGAAYSAGFGSEQGAGYVVDVRLATLKAVPDDVMEEIDQLVVTLLNERLPIAFPGQQLDVKRDGTGFKICGDLSF